MVIAKMARASVKNTKPYKVRITANEMLEKTYRKYLYPQEIDGITFSDDTEKKLSESTWFRCLSPAKQILVEKEMRERAKGEFGHKIQFFEDKYDEAAPAIPKPVMQRLCESLSATELKIFMCLVPYIHINDGLVREKTRKEMTLRIMMNICGVQKTSLLRESLKTLEAKRIIFSTIEKLKIRDKDLYLDLAALSTWQTEEYSFNQRILIYVNPFVVFFSQYIDKYTLPFFVNSGWYVLNPYAERIKAWIEDNCV